MLVATASTEASLLGQQHSGGERGHGFLRGVRLLHQADADARGTHGLHGPRAHAPNDHGLAIREQTRKAAVIMMMALRMVMALPFSMAILAMVLGPVLIVLAKFPVLDGAAFYLEDQEGLALPEVRGDGLAVHGGNGDLHGVSSWSGGTAPYQY
jgi:hypothetical protein